MQTSIDAAREARKPTESLRLAKAAVLVAATMLATLAGAAIAAGQPQGQMASDLATRDRDIRHAQVGVRGALSPLAQPLSRLSIHLAATGSLPDAQPRSALS
ncbi:hypothetical protein [Bradyrhizobium genosp. A]|uniref:hypothetical protein n=1 Tax=Bradyrhizobium genosp. A TaxID=83626 RepID=UPI003CED9B40